jgi:phosphate-selective porin OprO/OprP
VVGNFRVGHFKEPFSLEELTSSKYITFMERGLPNAFAIGRNTGLGIFNTAFDKRMTWAVGAFIDADDFGNSIGGGEYNVALRVTGLPWYEEKGRRLVHLGTSYSYGNTPDDAVRFRERPEAHLAPRYVDTGTFDAKNRNFVGFEAALVYDSLSVQGEVTGAFVDRKASGVDDPNFGGAYIYASYFLTGEHRPYKTSSGTFTNLKPENNFLNGEGGLGAWEVAARYSHIDLDDEGIRGGTLNDFTLGLNWYLNPNYRVSFNYIRAHLNGVGDTNIFEMRYQVAF